MQKIKRLSHNERFRKVELIIKEAAEYSNIGINKINEMLKNPRCSFMFICKYKNGKTERV